jgi:hypothetical protein
LNAVLNANGAPAGPARRCRLLGEVVDERAGHVLARSADPFRQRAEQPLPDGAGRLVHADLTRVDCEIASMAPP